jgi:hypothetical protein
MKLKKIQLLPYSVIFVVGCGNLNSIHHDFNVDVGNGALIDIKQRAIKIFREY